MNLEKKITSDKDLIVFEKSKFRKAFVAVFDLIHLDQKFYNLAVKKNYYKFTKSWE